MLSNCSALNKYGPLIGRICLSIIFIIAGWNKLTGFEGTLEHMSNKGLPLTELLLVLTIIIELGGGLMLFFGLLARWAALAIALFIIPVTIVFHPFWADPTQFHAFFKNLAILGGMLYIMVHGSGPYSIGKS